MRGRLVRSTLAAAIGLMALAAPALAHGADDARAIARGLTAGPYVISLWQVDGLPNGAMTPHVIVMFNGGAPAPASGVTITANGSPMDAYLSTTTPDSWETTQGVAEGESLSVTISDGTSVWSFGPAIVAPPPTSILPMREIILASILITLRALWWMAGRTARAWRRPAVRPILVAPQPD